MKKLFFMLLAAVSLIACGDSETSKSIELTGGTETSQVIFANETSKSEAIKFTAKESWTATVNETKADGVDWLTLSQMSGAAGDFALGMTFKENTSGESRKAEISIVCGITTITITVEQKGTDKPINPDDPKPKMRYVKKISGKNTSYGYEMTFEYDKDMRIAKIHNIVTDWSSVNDEKYETSSVMYFTYKDNTVSAKSKKTENGVEQEDENVFDAILNADGSIKQVILYYVNEEDVEKPDVANNKPMFATLSPRMIATKAIEYGKDIGTFTYDAQGHVVKVIQVEEYDSSEHTYTISWVDGNIDKVQTTFSSGSVAYDSYKYSNIENKPCNLNLSQVANGEWTNAAFGVLSTFNMIGKQNKFMPSSLVSGYDKNSYTRDYSYTVDGEGYIITCQEKKGVSDDSNDPNIPVIPGNFFTYTIEYVK